MSEKPLYNSANQKEINQYEFCNRTFVDFQKNISYSSIGIGSAFLRNPVLVNRRWHPFANSVAFYDNICFNRWIVISIIIII